MTNLANQSQEIATLRLLFEISRILDSTIDMHEVIGPILKTMAERMGMLRGTITLLDPASGEINIEAAYGLSEKQRLRGKYKPGEGVIGRVVQTGQPAAVPKISDEPLFLDRTGARKKVRKEDISFLCVPIKLDKQVIGTLSADRLFVEDDSLEEDLRLLTVIGSMLAQAVNLRKIARDEQRRLMDENSRLQAELKNRYRPQNIIGNSTEIQTVCDLIDQVSKSTATVLIRGESGTGKELVSSAIHYHSFRASKPYVKVNCAALPESIIESELFGHEKGAFTGAVSMRKGRFELADRGTILLDEIGYLSLPTQAKLLRVLQEREFERVGGTITIKVDVRVIAATNRDLEGLMEKDDFLQDLYYRLNVFPIHIPPLRERKSDILQLADLFIEKYSKMHDKRILRISTPAIDMLMSYHWPGNIRELENCVERSVLLSSDGVIHGHHLPPTLQTAEASGTIHQGSLETTLENVEREVLTDALKSARGNRAKAARALGISERIMGLRVDKYGIDAKRFRGT
ncbi:sigma 54-interacting transcriptional regulator [bacterium]|nr:sigma 54-interacting transcriptional regulator [bacterium]